MLCCRLNSLSGSGIGPTGWKITTTHHQVCGCSWPKKALVFSQFRMLKPSRRRSPTLRYNAGIDRGEKGKAESKRKRLWEIFVNVFSMANLHHENYQQVSMNLIDNAIISCSHFMKIIVALQFGCGWIRKIIAEFVNFFLNAQQLPFREKLKTF